MSHKNRLKAYMNDKAINPAHLSPSMDALMAFTCESLDIIEKKITEIKRGASANRMTTLKQKNGDSV